MGMQAQQYKNISSSSISQSQNIKIATYTSCWEQRRHSQNLWMKVQYSKDMKKTYLIQNKAVHLLGLKGFLIVYGLVKCRYREYCISVLYLSKVFSSQTIGHMGFYDCLTGYWQLSTHVLFTSDTTFIKYRITNMWNSHFSDSKTLITTAF